ncbi:MAG: LEPR-XLL domain-containing protein, partial [Deltaproteobacteria bacterium]|nr:LEPR-XLL domain-containing protein [Deltaproteobacteria bacterium]
MSRSQTLTALKSGKATNNFRRASRGSLFRLESLEPRVLLSADPLLGGTLQDLLLKNLQDSSTEELHPAIQEMLQDSSTYWQKDASIVAKSVAAPAVQTIDVSNISSLDPLNPVYTVGTDTILKGSGVTDLKLLNEGVVSPGHSPGVINVDTFFQVAGATLEIELAGYGGAGVLLDGFDQLNVVGAANFGGTLQVSLLNGFKPKVGDTFDIITFGTSTGIFTNLAGTYGFNSDYYFELVQTTGKIQLVCREIIQGNDFSFVSDVLGSAQNNSLGMLLNADYLTGSAPTSVTLTGSLDLGDSFKFGGSFTFIEHPTAHSYTLSDATTVSTTSITVSGSGISGFFGANPDSVDKFGLSFTGVDFGLALFDPVDQLDTRSWVVAEGSLTGTSVTNLSELNFNSGSMSFALDYGLGAGNTSVVNLSNPLDAITIGTHTFDGDGSLGERLDLAGQGISLSLASTVAIAGDVWFSADATKFAIAGEHVTANISVAGVTAGVTDATFGLISSKTGGTIMEASGGFALTGGAFASISADLATVKYNSTGVAYTDGFTVGSGAHTYTSGAFATAVNLSEVSVSNLNATVGGVFTISGDYGFKKNSVELDVISANATVAMTAGTYNIGVTNASFGLVVSASGTALESKGGVYAQLGSDIQISATDSSIMWTNNADVLTAANKTITTGALSYAFSDELVASTGIQEVRVSGAALKVGDFFNASGDFAFHKSSDITLTKTGGISVLADILTLGATVLNVFAGVNGGSADEMGLTLSGASFALAMVSDKSDSSKRWTALKATAAGISAKGMSDVTLSGSDIALALNLTADDGTTLDFTGTSLQVATGVTSNVTLDFKNELIQVSGLLDLVVANYFNVNGSFAFKKSQDTVTLNDGEQVDVDLLTLGGAGISAFAGLNAGAAEALGLSLTGVNFALVMASDNYAPERKWTSLKADVTNVAFVGVDGVTVSSDNLVVGINMENASDHSVIDYRADDLSVQIATSSSMTMDFDGHNGQIISAAGELSLNIFNFFSTDGSFAFEKKTDTLKVKASEADGGLVTDVAVDVLTLGGAGINAFAGMNGGSADALGLNLTGTDFALLFASDKADKNRSWTSLKASAESVSFTGIEGITVAGSDLSVQINRAATTDSSLLDFVSLAGAKYDVTVGPTETVSFDFAAASGALTTASGNLDLNLFNFFSVNGSFAFEKSIKTVTLSDATTVETDMLTIGASDVNAFAGLNGGSGDALGLNLGGVDLALALFASRTDATRKWTTLKAAATSVAFTGVEGLVLEANSLDVAINKAGADGTLINYAAQSVAVSAGTSGKTITLDIDGSKGELLEASGNLNINIFNFFSVSGSFAFKKSSDTVTLNDGVVDEAVPANNKPASQVDVDLLTVGGSGLNAFAGLNGGTTDALGLSLSDSDFALIFATDKLDTLRKWTTLKAESGSIGFVGVEGLTVSADTLSVEINRAATDTTVIDYKAQSLDVKTGPATTMTVDIDGGEGQLLRASGNLELNLFNFFSVGGAFALEKKTSTLTVTDTKNTAATTDDVTTAVTVDLLTLGGAGINAFAGMNGERDADGKLSSDALGLNLSGASFALVLASEQTAAAGTPKQNWTSLKASASEVAFVGIDGLTVSGTSLEVEINRKSADGRLLDYKTDKLEVMAGPEQKVTLDMLATDGELTRASGALDINLFGFFSVKGDFGFEKKVQAVKLTTGETITTDYMGIGASGVSAFAGLNGGTSDALGLALGQVDFALALMTDKTDKTRKFTTLKATAGSVSFTGVDGLVIEADTLNVAINKGYVTAAQAAKTIKTNTIMTLAVDAGMTGALNFSYSGSENKTATITGTETDAELGTKIQTALASLTGIGSGNVTVTGSKVAGYSIEFIGDLAGTEIKNLSVSTTAATAATAISTTTDAKSGINEIKQISISIPAQTPAPVTISAAESVKGFLGSNEIKYILFTDPYNGYGTYDISLSAEPTTKVTGVQFKQSMTVTNEANITTALISLFSLKYPALTITAADITVKFNTASSGGHQYDISFKSDLAGVNIPDITITNHLSSGRILPRNTAQGVSGSNETQTLSITNLSSATGSYALSLKIGSSTYTTAALALSASAADIQTALNSALTTHGTAAVSGTNGSYQITFSGGLAGQDVNLLTISKTVDTVTPSGSFTISTAGQSAQTVTYSSNSATQAANIKAAIDALYGTGATVTYAAASSTSSLKNYTISFSGALGGANIADISTNSSGLSYASVKPYNSIQGLAAVGESQQAVITTSATDGSFTISFGSQTTAALKLDATKAEVQTALSAIAAEGATITVDSFTGEELRLSFGGTLVGTDVAAISLTVTPVAASVELSIKQAGSTTVIPAVAAGTVVVDYSDANVSVLAGTSGKTITL